MGRFGRGVKVYVEKCDMLFLSLTKKGSANLPPGSISWPGHVYELLTCSFP